ncbi:MAG: hybrid sensor histidine kinase/response regulator [Deltaproteobacteria bacterium]|nr:hybrid sensor histidine kinase/response regulator [Deltaproteobacteria bacterium]
MRPLQVLLVEDSEDDALLVALELRRGGYAAAVTRVQSAADLQAALQRGPWDVVISDYSMPRFNGREALRLVRAAGGGEIPFVLVSGHIGEESAVEALKAGAGDFVMKQNLTRLVPAVEREMRDALIRRERRETLEALQRAVAARDQFLSIASHELKTPLTALQLQLQSLQRLLAGEQPADERMVTKVRTATRSAERLGELVNRLLEVSRLTTGQLELSPEPFDLAELVRRLAERFAEPLEDAGIVLAIHAPAPVRGRWDRGRVETIAASMLSNAIKYGAGRPVDLGAALRDGVARLWVRDRGIGIAPEDQARIFERFERAVPEHHYGGFGVGLWVARLVAEAHGGCIKVESKKGEGSTFTLELPRGEAP